MRGGAADGRRRNLSERNSRAEAGEDAPQRVASVEIYQAVLERMWRALAECEIEDGGKFLGSFSEEGGKVLVRVESYIDSGPCARRSASHLYPDGEYQEALFRLVERFKPEIEHIGSWHSHHCNGLGHLSRGDVTSYVESVNSPCYNPDLFFAMLVTGLQEATLQARYYLFSRGTDDYREIGGADVQVVLGVSPLEPLLLEAERVARGYRRG